MIRIKRRYLTLMELLVVLAILGIALGAIGIGLADAVRKERFRAGTAFLVERIRVAQDLMIVLEVDVKLRLAMHPEGLLVDLQTDAPLPKGFDSIFNEPVFVNGIKSVSFTTPQGGRSEQELILEFLSRGSRMSQGTLEVSGQSADESLTRYITLHGYPTAIQAQSRPQTLTDFDLESSRLYPPEVIEEERRRNEEKEARSST